jgi:cysteine desulfurase family protein (TIGR01976 family)
MAEYFLRSNANSGGVFAASMATDEIWLRAREGMADFLNGAADEIAFGANMTTLNYHLTRGLGRDLHAGDEVVVTLLDHDGNIAPWLALEEERGVVVRFAELRAPDWQVDLEHLASLIGPRTRVVAFPLASNALGTLPDARAIVDLAHAAGALAWVDAVHYGPHGPIDVQALGCDVLLCSAYKFFGPHLGVLWGRSGVLESLRPYQVRPASQEVPDRFETGTRNYEALAGLLGTLRYLEELGQRADAPDAPALAPYRGRGRRFKAAMLAARDYERSLSEQLLVGLAEIPGVTVYGVTDPGQSDRRVPTMAFRVGDQHPRRTCELLAEAGINAWDGNYYALAVMERLGLEASGGAVRIGLVHYNTAAEADRFLEAVREIASSG